MRNPPLGRLRVLAAAAAALTLAAGCAPIRDWLKGEDGRDTGPVAAGPATPSRYVQELYELASGDPATQAEIYADAAAAASLTPDTVSRLRFALVLAMPGHSGSDPERAQDILRDLLSRPELLTPVEKSLAVIHLQDVEERLVLDAEARRLRAETSRAERTEEAAVAQRIAAIEAENRRLKQSLAEAEQKLEAITTIERSIREQTDNNNSNR
ncbi:MAG TPA: hypothetical protein VFG91_13850 [Woeseiaceae bacterium]|nr:hypothetical protein [Woeseiaceae bacterium]